MAVIKKADKLDMVACAFNPKNMEEETGASGVKGHPQLHIEFKANLGYMKLWHRITKKQIENKYPSNEYWINYYNMVSNHVNE